MLSKQKTMLQGSQSRDLFKQLHKQQLADNCYALDIDFALVEFNEHNGTANPCVVAIVDFKTTHDTLTATEILAYNWFNERETPVFIVKSESENFVETVPSNHRFTVEKYLSGEWQAVRPTWDGEVVKSNATWDDLQKWEDQIRQKRRREMRSG